MLTRDDLTVEDAPDVLDEIAILGLKHLGFKDLGVDRGTLRHLARRVRELGATSYLEVVSTTPEACLASARAAVEIGVDRLLGGTAVDEVLAILRGTPVAYYPFPGFPEGHPTRLRGGPADVARHCHEAVAKGCAGVDLLAYRAVEAEPLALVRAARAALEGATLIVAGSVDGPGRVAELAAAGVDAFTIGSAVFDGSFSPRKGTLRARLRDVLAASGSAAA